MRMGFSAFITTAIVGVLFSLNTFARSETTGHQVIADIEALAMKCVVRTYTVNEAGKRVYTDLKNTCSAIELLDAKSALVHVDNQTFKVVVIESEDSDGGDLDHVLVYDQDGELVGQKLNVVAYDNILLGLAGGKTGFAEVEETSK